MSTSFPRSRIAEIRSVYSFTRVPHACSPPKEPLILLQENTLNQIMLQFQGVTLSEWCVPKIAEVFWDQLTPPRRSGAPLSSIMLGIIWFLGSLSLTVCFFAALHCLLTYSIPTSSTLSWGHVYTCHDCGHVESTWCKMPRSLWHIAYTSLSVYPHNVMLVGFGRRSYVDRNRNDIANGSIATSVFHDSLIGLISLHVVQAHSSITMSRFLFGENLVAWATYALSIGLCHTHNLVCL